MKNYNFAVTDLKKIQLEDYSENEFSVARMGFLSTRPNAHELEISEQVLRVCAGSVLGKWLVVDMSGIVDAGTHTEKEHIVGRIPRSQEVEFVEDEDGYLRAYVDVIVSKIYAKDFLHIFENDNERAVSVEMTVESEKDNENVVTAFNIVGVTCLGHLIAPSCPQSDIVITRFSVDEAENMYNKIHKESLTALKKFAEERKERMANAKTYKVDKSKEAMSDKSWGDVDKTALRNKIMDATNRSSLVKDVYMLVEDGWEDAPSEKLKYPVMELKGDTLVYNRDGLASALGYAKKENETTVINKVQKIYKKLGLELEDDGKEETKKMAQEIEFAAVELSDMWQKIDSALRERHYDWEWYIAGIYEESNQKFAVIRNREGDRFRIDFSYTEEGLVLADEMTKVNIEFVETDEVRRFAVPEEFEHLTKCADEEDKDDDKDEKDDEDDKDEEDDDKKDEDVEMSADEMKDKISQMRADIESRDNIIMDKDQKIASMESELSELRAFKEGIEKKELMNDVEALMAEVKECMSEDNLKSMREEGMACKMSELDAWKNKVKAMAFENVKKPTKKNDGIFSFSSPLDSEKKETGDVWERLKNR